MLAKLFGRLTTPGAGAEALFDRITREARTHDWYRDGAVPDTVDGRFAVLATLCALAIVRLEQLDEAGVRQSVILTERFAHVMESEHREMGLGDPTLGKTVLKLVGALAGRVELWRGEEPGSQGWTGAAERSLPPADEDVVAWRAMRLADYAALLRQPGFDKIGQGEDR